MNTATENLADHTWLKIGGQAEIATPQSEEDLVNLLRHCQEIDRPYRILGNGSNLLVSDDGVDELVIKTTECCTSVDISEDIVKAGASVMVPQFVSQLIEHDLGGYEFLYSVPGTIGGAIYMNAGRGKQHNKTIADHLLTVSFFDGTEIRTREKSELNFAYRYSIFHEHPNWVILSATFSPPEQPQEMGRKLAKERMEKVGKRERSKPNAGSVFKSGVRIPLGRIPPNGLSVDGARFVSSNRICHDGNATSKDVYRLVKLAQLVHRIVPPFSKPEIEWEIWK